MFQGMGRIAMPAVVAVMGLAMAVDPAAAARYGTPTFTVQAVGKSVASVRVTAAPDGAVGGFRIQWMSKADFIARAAKAAQPGYFDKDAQLPQRHVQRRVHYTESSIAGFHAGL